MRNDTGLFYKKETKNYSNEPLLTVEGPKQKYLRVSINYTCKYNKICPVTEVLVHRIKGTVRDSQSISEYGILIPTVKWTTIFLVKFPYYDTG